MTKVVYKWRELCPNNPFNSVSEQSKYVSWLLSHCPGFKEQRKAAKLKYHATHPDRAALTQKKQNVKRKFNLTVDEYDAIVKKPCEICGTTDKRRVLDHTMLQES